VILLESFLLFLRGGERCAQPKGKKKKRESNIRKEQTTSAKSFKKKNKTHTTYNARKQARTHIDKENIKRVNMQKKKTRSRENFTRGTEKKREKKKKKRD
jgi:hypothetical protein